VRPLALLVLIAALLVAATPAGAAAPRRCGNVRLDQELKPDPKGLFGAFRIRSTHATCGAARAVALRYTQDLHALDHRTVSEGSWRCTFKEAHVAQQVFTTCRRGSAKVTFAYKIPNG
jgi:hypothetical protein